jgi:hypothetical protein
MSLPFLLLSFIHYILFIAVVLQNFIQLITVTYYFTITACLWWNFHSHYTIHRVHNTQKRYHVPARVQGQC